MPDTELLTDQQIAEIEVREYVVEGWSRFIKLRPDERDSLIATVKQLRVELRRWRNGDVLPDGWTCLDAGDGFPNLYLYSRADIVEQAKQRLVDLQSQLEQLRTERDFWRTRATEASKAAEKWYHERY